MSKLRAFAVYLLVGVCLCFVNIVIAQPLNEPSSRPDILILHSYHPAVWTGEVRHGIESIFTEDSGVILRHEYMDTKSFNSQEYYQFLYTLYEKKYRGIKFDTIIASDDNAYQFALKHQDSLFQNAPLVFCGVGVFNPDQIKGRPVTGILEVEPLEETLDLAVKLFPQSRTVYFVSDDTTTGQNNLNRLTSHLTAAYPQMGYEVLQSLSYTEMLDQIKRLPEDSFVVFVAWWKDRTGQMILQEEQLQLVLQSNRPVFTFSDWIIARSPAAGKCTSPYQMGKAAAQLAEKIITGTNPADLPVIKDAHTQYPYLFNWDMLHQYNIPLSSLPKDREILNPPPSKYEIPHEVLWGLMGGMMGLMGIVIVLFIFARYHRKMNISLAQKEARFRGLVETSSDWIWETDAQMVCTYNSPQVTDILGYTPEELLGTRPFDYMIPEQAEQVKQYAVEFTENDEKILSIVVKLQSKDGRQVIIESNGVAVHDDKGEIIAYRGVNRDVTEQQRQRLQLEEQRGELQSIFRASPTGIGVVIDRTFIQVNKQVCEISGYSEKELIGQNARMLYPNQQEYEYVGREKYRQISESGVGTVETKWRRKDGKIVDILMSSAPFDMANLKKGVAFSVLDITDRKRAEQQIRENEAYLSSVLNTAPTGIIVLANRIIKNVNDQYCQMFGYSRQELIGQNILKLYRDKKEYDRVGHDLYAQMRNEGRGNIETQMQSKDGTVRDILITGMPIDFNDWEKGITFTVLDVTERNRAEKQILRERSFSDQIIDSLPAVFCLIDQHRRCLRWNDAFQAVTEYTAEEVKSLDLMNLFQGADRNIIEERIADAFSSGKASAEVKLVTKSGTMIPYYLTARHIEFNGQPCVIGTGTDLTQIRQAEKAVRQAEQRMELALQGGDLGTWDWDINSGSVIVNERWAAMLGYGTDELDMSYDTWKRLIHPDDQPSVFELIKDHLQGRTEFYEAEFRLKHKAGHWIWALSKGQLIERDAAGNPVRMCGTHLDVTDRKRAEEAMAKRIVALTRPLDSAAELVFEELFDLNEIQHLQDLFAESTGVASIITQVDGTPITRPSNFCRLCSQIIRASEEGGTRCRRSDSLLGRHKPDGPVIQQCLSGGLWDAGAGITVGGRHIANWLIGQVRDETQTEEDMREYARQINVDEEEYIKAFYEVPTMSKQRFERIAQTLFEIAKQLSTMAYQNIQQARFIYERQQAEEQLSKRLKLEKLVSTISSGFIDLPVEQLSEQIKKSFKMLVNVIGIERIALAELNENQDRIYYTNYAARDDSAPLFATNDLDRDFPEYAERIRTGSSIWLSHLPDDLSEDDVVLRRFCEKVGLKSHVRIPMVVGQQLIGAILISHLNEYLQYDQDVFNYLKLIADILANTIIRQRSKKALEQSEQQFRNIIESCPLGVHTYTLNDRDELIFTGTNNAAQQILGVDYSVKIGQTMEEVFSFLIETDLPEIYRKIARQGGYYHCDNFGYNDERVGGCYEFDVFQISPGKIAAMFNDVTERIKNREALQFTQFAIDHASEPTFWLDDQGKLSYVNDAACQVLGYTREELLQMTVPELDPNFPQDIWPEHWERTKRFGSRRFETQHRTKDGHLVPVEITTNFVSYAGKEYHCAFARDITERKRYEEAIGDFLRVVATETGGEMFNHFAGQLCNHLNADMALIGQIVSGNPDVVQTLAVAQAGQLIDNFEYSLAGTPCEKAIKEQGGFCAFSDNVAEQFSNDLTLSKFNVRSYIGTPLFDQQKQPLGIICALFKRPLESTVFSESILQIHANQAALELQRLREQDALERLMFQLQNQNEELEKVTATLEASMEQTPAGILILDAQSMQLSFANLAAQEILGDTIENITEISYLNPVTSWQNLTSERIAYPHEDKPLMRAVQKGEYTENRENIIVRPDGSERWIMINAGPIRDAQGAIQAGITIFYDITQQKRAEEALKESEAKHRLLFTTSNDAILIMDELKFLEFNPRALQMFGCKQHSDLANKSPADFSPKYQEDGQLSTDKAEKLLSEALQGIPQQFSWVHRRLDGTFFYVEISLSRLELDGRNLVAAILRDVTEKRLADQGREKLMRELQSKNEELESIVFIASHDLRSPLVNIRGFTGELEKSLQQLQKVINQAEFSEKDKKQLDYLFNVDMPESMKFIKLGNQKMDILLNGLLRLSRIGTAQINPETLNMNEMLTNIVNSFQFQMKEQSITIQVQEKLPNCCGDHVLINQVFTNLIDNAIKYSAPDRPAVIKVTGRKTQSTVEYQVADNGIGIAKEHLNKVFDIFHQLNPSASKAGEGLGLTIVRRILDRQGGTIRMESEPDTGTSVFVQLPKA